MKKSNLTNDWSEVINKRLKSYKKPTKDEIIESLSDEIERLWTEVDKQPYGTTALIVIGYCAGALSLMLLLKAVGLTNNL